MKSISSRRVIISPLGVKNKQKLSLIQSRTFVQLVLTGYSCSRDQGTYFWPVSAKYVGEYKDDKKHGQATLLNQVAISPEGSDDIQS